MREEADRYWGSTAAPDHPWLSVVCGNHRHSGRESISCHLSAPSSLSGGAGAAPRTGGSGKQAAV